MLTIGIDSYITVTEADAYLALNYTKFNPVFVSWGAIDEVDKEVYLRQAAIKIDALMLHGQKWDTAQTMQFPRKRIEPNQYYLTFRFGPMLGWSIGEKEVPPEVKAAQAEEAIALLDKDINARSDMQFKTAQSLGMQKNIKHSKREMGDIGTQAEMAYSPAAPTSVAKSNKIMESKKALDLLKPWLYGGFRG